MLKKLRQQQKGFTIIEILIVLAIAALILLIIFFAVPALQRNNRNTQIRNDAAVVLGYVNDFAANNNGAIPAEVCYNATTGDVGMENVTAACDPTTHKVGQIRGGITLSDETTEVAAADPQILRVNLGRGCNSGESGADETAPNNRLSATANARAVAISFQTERQGGETNQCTES